MVLTTDWTLWPWQSGEFLVLIIHLSALNHEHDLFHSVLYVDKLCQHPNSCLGLCWSLNQLSLLEYFSHLMRKRSGFCGELTYITL